ncbi:hypothetical protein LP419_09660 [Massilia sp. H-1]|nr:hypothetical protein LP419_09660 [Massilia sp. H-1]
MLRLASAPLFDVPVFALPAGISDTLALALDTPAVHGVCQGHPSSPRKGW